MPTTGGPSCAAPSPPRAVRPPPRRSTAARRSARQRITRLRHGDLRLPDPLGDRSRYDVVISAYCADLATDDPEVWALYMRRIVGLVRPGGLLLVAALGNARGYIVGSAVFPSASIGADDLRRGAGADSATGSTSRR